MTHKASYDALLNEYKGNLFEFLVALELAKEFKLEREFLTLTYNENAHILEQQESFLRNYFPDLLISLPKLANLLKCKLQNEFKFSNIFKIQMVGKSLGAAGDNRFDEADILLFSNETDRITGLSIKLAKRGSYVNTKSAGIKSFFTKYFSKFSGFEIQEKFNLFMESEFEKMSMEMHEEAGIIYSSGFVEWENAGLESLPGKLGPDFKKFLLAYYHSMNNKIFTIIQTIYEKDPILFSESVWNILGLSSDKIIQVIYLHSLSLNNKSHDEILINQRGTHLKFLRFECKKNYFEMIYENFKLQVRLKPMNKFTAKSYKINLAVKYNT